MANAERLAQPAPLTGRRERNKLEKRARIVDAARELFHRQGFAETTTQQIAAEADIGTGTLFLYVKSKEDLLVMVFKDEMLETLREILGRLPRRASPVDQLMAVFEQMIAYHARDVDLSRVLLRELVMPSSLERRGDVSELMDAIYGGLANIVRPATDTPEVTARSAFALYYFALISWLGRGFDRKSVLRQLREQLSALLHQRA
jgi:AcrR family transcriptional regulator